MEKGFIIDQSEDDRNKVIYHSYWVEGEPIKIKSIITGKDLDHLNLNGRKTFTIRALRCENCGFLESYAI